ncbi:ABC transporter permease subunit [Streptomyces sp. NPDC001985]|uniref:ABC transporter permease subunit n=1 Tax=Streptomyces sp. NPDC001985 TaxID=3154406 RepID=UPI003316BEA4
MMWLSWRQFRLQALAGAGALLVIAAYLLYTGMEIRDGYEVYRAHCQDRDGAGCARAKAGFRGAHQNTLLFLATGLALIPAVLGTFWGAPLVARELENGTHRLVWNQSVTRTRWLLGKVLLAVSAAMVLTGVASACLTWAAAPFDEVVKERFDTLVFGARNIAPIGHAALAVTLGTTIGLLLRRTLPAMAVTLVGFIAFQFFFPNVVRPGLMPPERATLPMTVEVINGARSLGSIGGGAVIGGVTVPGEPDAWIAETGPLRTADGKPLGGAEFNACLDSPPSTGTGGTFGDTAACLAERDLRVDVLYHPGSRYWAFQWLETAIHLLLSGVLLAVSLRRIGRRAG